MNEFKLNTIEEAIEDIRNGKVIIVVDDADRENEGDFLVASHHASPEVVNFMATHGRGLICISLTEERCTELDLPMMVNQNTQHLMKQHLQYLLICSDMAAQQVFPPLTDPKQLKLSSIRLHVPRNWAARDISSPYAPKPEVFYAEQAIPKHRWIWLDSQD
jgi:hypothetical protein